MNSSPRALSRAESISASNNPSPSRNESSPKSASPVCLTAAAVRSSDDATPHLLEDIRDSTLPLIWTSVKSAGAHPGRVRHAQALSTSSALRASAHRRALLFAQALIGVLC